MKILFATGNQNKINEAKILFNELDYSIEGLKIKGKLPNFVEPQSNDLEVVAVSKLKQAVSLLKNNNLEEYAILVEDSGFIY